MVSIRKAKKAEKMQAKLNAENNSKKNEMSLDEAYSLVDKIYKNPDAVINWRELDKALGVIGVSDAHFAAEMKKDFELREAYQIVGGYYQYGKNALQKTMDKRFNQALNLIEKDDAQFAEAVRRLYEEGLTFKKANSEQLLSAEQVARNAQDIAKLVEDKEVVRDINIEEVLANTPATGLSAQEVQDIALNTAELETIEELTGSAEFNEGTSEQKRSMFAFGIRHSMKKMLLKARLSSVSKSISNIKKAFNFKEKITVASKSIASAYERAVESTSAYIKGLSEKGHTKAATFLNKAKTRIQSSMIKLATASVLVGSLLPGCADHKSQNTQAQAPAGQEKVVVLNDTTKTSASVVSDTVQNKGVPVLDVTSSAASSSIVVPTEWADSLGVSKGNWKVNQTFLNYENAYKKITDDMLQKSGFKTRDQFLDAYRILRSFYPKVVENQGDVLLERSEVSDKFSRFFNNDDCVKANEFTAEDFAILKMAPTLRGTLNRRATQEVGVNEDCAPGKVKYVSGVVRQANNQESDVVEQDVAPVVAPVANEVVVPVDTVPTFNETGRSRISSEYTTQTTAATLDVYKGNTLDDGKKIDSRDAADMVGASVTNKKDIMVEQTVDFVETGSSRVDSTVTTPEFTFVESGSSRVDSTETTPEFTFVESGSSRVDSTETTPEFTFVESGRSRVVATAESENIQVVEDSAELPVGTPSAGYVPERGGVDNCGLTEKQLQYSKSKIMERNGSSAYEDLMDGISDEMLSKGNIFEGLTREQAIYTLSVWSVTFPHSAETALIYDYVLNCHQGETMSAEDMAKAKAAMDRIRTNKTIDGVVYNKPIYVTNVKNIGCDEKVQVTSVRLSGNVSPKSPSGPKFKRLFGLKPQKPEPIQYSFEVEFGRSSVVTEQVVSETKEAVLTKHKANGLSGGKKVGEMNVADLSGKSVTNVKDVMVENSGSSTRSEKATEGKTKKAKKAKQSSKSLKQKKQEAADMARQEWLRLQQQSM